MKLKRQNPMTGIQMYISAHAKNKTVSSKKCEQYPMFCLTLDVQAIYLQEVLLRTA